MHDPYSLHFVRSPRLYLVVLEGVIEEEAEEDQYSLESAGSAPVMRFRAEIESKRTTLSEKRPACLKIFNAPLYSYKRTLK